MYIVSFYCLVLDMYWFCCHQKVINRDSSSSYVSVSAGSPKGLFLALCYFWFTLMILVISFFP